MKERDLVERLAKVLDVREGKENFAFEVFKKYLTENLETGKAVKVPGVGLFQLKREPVPREERKSSGGTKDFLVFVPAESSEEVKVVKDFLQIPVESNVPKDDEHIADIFSLSVNKPLAPVAETGEDETPVTEKVEKLMLSAEVQENLDILSSLFSPTPVATEEKEEEILKESLAQQEAEEEVKNQLVEEKEIETETKEEAEDFWDTNLEKELIEEEEPAEELSISEKQEEENSEEKISGEEAPELTEAEGNSVEVTAEEKAEKSNPEEKIEEDPFGALEESINEAVEEEIPEEEIEEIVERNETVVEEEPAEDSVEETKEEEQEESPEAKKSKKKYYYIGAAVLLVLIYLIFFTGGGNKEPEKIVQDTTKTEKQAKPKIVAKLDSAKPVSKVNNTAQIKSGQKQTKSQASNKGITKQQMSASLYKNIKKEKSVSKNIYYDGKEYMVQVSSWRNPMLAEIETKRLRKKGLKAFIVKAYVRRFKKYFYRVRIGGFETLEQAKIFRQKNIK